MMLILMLPGISIHSQVRFGYSSDYRYLKGSDATTLASNWMEPGFDDSSWETGMAPFWYGDGAGGTVLEDMQNSYSTLYLRSTFSADNVLSLKELEISVDYDDGFVMWINGTEILRQNTPAEPGYDAFALANHESGQAESFLIDSADVPLAEGENTLAVHLLNVSLASSDIHFKAGITADPALPELDSVTGTISFSQNAGFYYTPFSLNLAAQDSGLGILYTLDGSNPRSSPTAIPGDSSLSITIDPASTEGRAATPAVTVRASLYKEGYTPSFPVTRTYIFIDEVRNQTYPGPPFPSSDVNGQELDWEMDPEVVSDSRYSDLIEEALLDIPSYSLVTDNDNLFHPSSGIFVNAENYGRAWERDCSLELIDPDGEGFQVNAGVRIRGGASRADGNPKHAFRIFFRREYGAAKLEYPLFGDEGTDRFDNVDLRTEQNFAWNRDGDPWGAWNTFVRDIFARTSQREMGRPYTRSRYGHLYVNGVYWGLFMTQERAEASFAESYFGDDKEDYDVIKVTTEPWPYYNIATDGNMDAWEEVWDRCRAGFTSNARYFDLEGRDENGEPAGTRVWVDVENLIDYMIMIFYTGSYDGPVSAWGGEEMPNNYYAIFNRKNSGKGFVFLAHDMEQCMFVHDYSVADGLHENRVTIPDMRAASLLQFQPQWLHHKLTDNAEYRMRFADRAVKYLGGKGLFTGDTVRNMFMDFAGIIDKAIIAESARWGDTKVSTPRTRDDDWLPALAEVTDIFCPQRTDIVIGQLLDAGLYSEISPPKVLAQDRPTTSEIHYFDGSLPVQISNENPTAEIWYTLDGRDPRMIGGNPSPGALHSAYDVNMDIERTTVIRARSKDGETWSALTERYFISQTEDYTGLKVTELHYHPPSIPEGDDTIPGRDLEFLELKNTGLHAVDISGLVFDSAISFKVPAATVLNPGGFYVIASKPEIFYDAYGINPSGNYSGHFSNAGEYVLLSNPVGDEILSFTYDDAYPWPLFPDGMGYSLTSAVNNPAGDPDDPAYWKQSTPLGGTPFADDGIELTDGNRMHDPAGKVFSVFPNPAREMLTIRSNCTELTNVLIYNNSGSLVYCGTFSSGLSIPCSEIGNGGIYFVRLVNRDTVTTEKVLILD
jgi:hypothetical protein